MGNLEFIEVLFTLIQDNRKDLLVNFVKEGGMFIQLLFFFFFFYFSLKHKLDC